jgi:hypothetical protein
MLLTAPIVQPQTEDSSAATQPSMQTSGRALLPTVTTQPTSQPATTQATPTVTLPGGFPVEYRSFARQHLGATQNLRLKGLKFRRKWAVIYSAEDLSTGLVGQQVDGINGYTPACATEIMRRLVLNLSPANVPADGTTIGAHR